MIEIFPAIDVIDGKAVRLSQGDYARMTVYEKDPLDAARRFEDHGLKRLHLVDLDGAKAGRVINFKVLERIANKTGLRIDVGGGVKSEDDLRIVFECGAAQVNIGSIAVKDRERCAEWIAMHGPEKIVLSADAKNEMVAISGWTEKTETKLIDFLKEYAERGIRYTACTDIERDGMMAGPATDLYKRIQDECPEMRLIASGGVRSIQDIEALEQQGLFGVIIGRALYEGAIVLKDLKRFVA